MSKGTFAVSASDVEHDCQKPNAPTMRTYWECKVCKAEWHSHDRGSRGGWSWFRDSKGSLIWRWKEARRIEAELNRAAS